MNDQRPTTETATSLQTRARTSFELPPQMSSTRILVNAAAGQSDDGYTTLTMSDAAAQVLAEILIRYNTAVVGDGTEEPVALRVEDDHDVAFWDGVACDLMVATEIPPPAARTTLVYSIGKTADR